METLTLDFNSAMAILQPFMPSKQFALVKQLQKGEEAEYFDTKMARLAGIVEAMPKTHETKDPQNPIVSLHYFAGDCHWYIIEKDIEDGVSQAFGYALLNGDLQCAEVGYISITEIVENHVQLDFHFSPKPLSEVKAEMNKRYGR
jgi:Protein of unknown function (DUF2958)